MLGRALKFLCKMLKMSCKLLKSRDGTSWFDNLLEFRKHSALEKAEETYLKPNEKTMKFSKFSDRLRFIDAGISVFEDTYLKEKQAEIRKGTTKKYIFISSDIWFLISSCYLQGMLRPQGYLLDIWGDDLDNPSTIPKEVPSSEIVVSLPYNIFFLSFSLV